MIRASSGNAAEGEKERKIERRGFIDEPASKVE